MLEAQDRVCGRVMDDTSFGRCVSLGAMIVTGICNNPIVTMCKQVSTITSPCVCCMCVCLCMCVCVVLCLCVFCVCVHVFVCMYVCAVVCVC